MLSAVVLGLLIAGGSAQLNPVQRGDDCRAVTDNSTWQYCGSLATNNIYWNYAAEPAPGQLTILVEGRDNAWRAVGFTSNADANQMQNSRVAFGCQDINQTADVIDIFIAQKSPESVMDGMGNGNQSLTNINEIRANGVCGFRFTRPAEPPLLQGLEPAALALQNVAQGVPNTIISAWAANQNMLTPHTLGDANSRIFAQVDFIAGTADLNMFGMVMPLDGPDNTMAPTMGPDPANNPDGAAAALQISSAVVAGAMSLLAALW